MPWSIPVLRWKFFILARWVEKRRDLQWPLGQLRHMDEYQSARGHLHLEGNLFHSSLLRNFWTFAYFRTVTSSGAWTNATSEAAQSNTSAFQTRSSTWLRKTSRQRLVAQKWTKATETNSKEGIAAVATSKAIAAEAAVTSRTDQIKTVVHLRTETILISLHSSSKSRVWKLYWIKGIQNCLRGIFDKFFLAIHSTVNSFVRRQSGNVK